MAFTDVEMAILSQLAYKDIPEGDSLYGALCSNTEYLLSDDGLGPDYKTALNDLCKKSHMAGYTIVKSQGNTSSGFSAFAVEDPINNSVTVACRGTELGKRNLDSVIDVGEDVTLALSKQTAQQKDMESFTKNLSKNYDKYSFAGHSLGGNLAMHGAITLEDKSKLDKCTTFNAPGFNDEYWLSHSGIDAAKGKMTAYQNKYDGVSEVGKVPGTVIILKSKGKSILGLEGHSLGDLIIKDNGFATSKEKSTTGLGIFLKLGSKWMERKMRDEKTKYDNLFGVMPLTSSNSSADISFAGGNSSKKIELTPAELKAQASQMLSLGNEYEHLFDRVISDLSSVNKNWSPNLAHNFTGKITSTQVQFRHISNMLATGSAVASMTANNFESTDSLLAKIMISDLSKQDNGSIVGAVKGSVGKTSRTI